MATTTSTVQNLIILGDSLSDIGTEVKTRVGRFAEAFNLMTLNEVNRFSDGRNWADFLLEWAGNPLVDKDRDASLSKTSPHLRLGANSTLQTSSEFPARYANYAQGGAVAASDYKGISKENMLGHLAGQVDRYIEDRKSLTQEDKNAFEFGHTVHIIWIGMNDIITVGRDQSPPKTTWGPSGITLGGGEPEPGQGMRALVNAIGEQINKIDSEFPASRNRYLVINLPGPTITNRWHDELSVSKEEKAQTFSDEAVRYNALLKKLVLNSKSNSLAQEARLQSEDLRNRVTLVDMYDWMSTLYDSVKDFNFIDAKQKEKLPVRYGPEEDYDPGAQNDEKTTQRRCFTTTDGLHPTEAVYEFIAWKILDDLLLNNLTLGEWNKEHVPAGLKRYIGQLQKLLPAAAK
ncbi:SGNH/GDSL hydrolase family protein [Streptomyces sp. 900105245]